MLKTQNIFQKALDLQLYLGVVFWSSFSRKLIINYCRFFISRDRHIYNKYKNSFYGYIKLLLFQYIESTIAILYSQNKGARTSIRKLLYTVIENNVTKKKEQRSRIKLIKNNMGNHMKPQTLSRTTGGGCKLYVMQEK